MEQRKKKRAEKLKEKDKNDEEIKLNEE